ncbi:hypothetical protein [Enterobacter roggenkampii]|uniref:hypothetical protein n=1 Tax=Enterobacter roggenkampii TaxID=1812935 RepID=UPI001FD753C7|nr:hypothetical protein [Enterobacter roggenkampii]
MDVLHASEELFECDFRGLERDKSKGPPAGARGNDGSCEPYHRRAIDSSWYDTTADCSEDSSADARRFYDLWRLKSISPNLVEPRNGKVIVAKLEGDNEVDLKKLCNLRQALPLLTSYPMIEVNGTANYRLLMILNILHNSRKSRSSPPSRGLFRPKILPVTHRYTNTLNKTHQ